MAQGILIALKRRSRMMIAVIVLGVAADVILFHLPIWGPLGPTLIQGVIGLVLAIALAVVAAAMISRRNSGGAAQRRR